MLEELRLIEEHLGQLDQQMANLLAAHHEAVQRLAEVPGLGVDSAQQIIVKSASPPTFPSPKHLASGWVRAPARGERGQELQSPLPQGQPADATRLESGGQRRGEGEGHHLRDRVSPARPTPRPRPSHRCDHPPALSPNLEDSSPGRAVRGRGPAVSEEAKKVRARKMIRELRSLDYRVELLPLSSPA